MRFGLFCQLGQNFGDGLNFAHHAHALAGHDRAMLHIAINHGFTQRTCPKMLDFELRFFFAQFARAMLRDRS